jgi:hypothetical protein
LAGRAQRHGVRALFDGSASAPVVSMRAAPG